MGVIYTIACHDCKIKQNMDKWYGFRQVINRKEALEKYHGIQTPDFRAILAVSFLYKHNGHRIEVRNDSKHDDCFESYLEPVDYWDCSGDSLPNDKDHPAGQSPNP